MNDKVMSSELNVAYYYIIILYYNCCPEASTQALCYNIAGMKDVMTHHLGLKTFVEH